MSVKKVQGHIDAIQRKLEKSIKIADKGPNMKLGDVIKLGRKTNSIVSEIKKSISEYDVGHPYSHGSTFQRGETRALTQSDRAPILLLRRHKSSSQRWRRSSS